MTTTKYLLPQSQSNLILEVLDEYHNSQGHKMMLVKALGEKPFVGGDKWPIRTEYGTCEEFETECGCVLPEQSCPACRRAARRCYGEDL